MISFRGKFAPDWVLSGLEAGTIGAFCLFNYNFETPAQLRALNDSLREAAARGGHPPPLIGIDQEGGQLMAVNRGATDLPGNMALGAARVPDLAYRAGQVLARELLALGCNMNFAPVLDLATHLDSNVVGVRAFSDDPHLTGQLGAALTRGLQDEGVLATAKHFPGHGDTALDSHHVAPRIDRTLDQLRAEDLGPFSTVIAGGIGAIMSAHVTYPHLDAQPATLSRVILHDLLRVELGFDGLVVTDAMDMSAVAHLTKVERCIAALDAGADLVLLGHLTDQEQIARELAQRTHPDATRRLTAARAALATELPDVSVVGSGPHAEFALESAAAAITRVRGRSALGVKPAERVAVVSFDAAARSPADSTPEGAPQLAAHLTRYHPDTIRIELPAGAGAHEVLSMVAESGAARLVIATRNAAADPQQVELVREACRRGPEVFVVALGSPLDAAVLPFAPNVLCTYGLRPPQLEAAARVLCGLADAPGRLPVRLPGTGAPA